jgi:hypothetical protein
MGRRSFFMSVSPIHLAFYILIKFNIIACFVENLRFFEKIKNKSTKKAKKKIKNLSVQLQLLTFATPT